MIISVKLTSLTDSVIECGQAVHWFYVWQGNNDMLQCLPRNNDILKRVFKSRSLIENEHQKWHHNRLMWRLTVCPTDHFTQMSSSFFSVKYLYIYISNIWICIYIYINLFIYSLLFIYLFLLFIYLFIFNKVNIKYLISLVSLGWLLPLASLVVPITWCLLIGLKLLCIKPLERNHPAIALLGAVMATLC